MESGADVQYGRNVGLSILAVQKFAKQMLISLKHLKNCGVLHADIKLDNILVNDKHNLIKVRLRESPWASCAGLLRGGGRTWS